MRNFNIYDPIKRGQGLVLDGQTLAHIEVSCHYPADRLVLMHGHFQVLQNSEGTEEGTLLKLLSRCITPSGTFSQLPLHPLDGSYGPRRQAPVPYLAVHASARGRRHQRQARCRTRPP